jgi:hypothetical protein
MGGTSLSQGEEGREWYSHSGTAWSVYAEAREELKQDITTQNRRILLGFHRASGRGYRARIGLLDQCGQS